LEFSSNLNLNFQQFNWVFNNRSSQDLMDIKEDLIESSLESSTIAVMKIDANRAKTGWDFSRTGTFPNRPSLTYKATFKPNQGETMYLLNNGLVLYQSSTKRVINKALPNTIASSELVTDGYNYIFNYSSNTWYEYRMPPATPNAKVDIDFLLDAFWTGVKIVGRYATPLEDAIILIDGKDFDGELSNQTVAGAMILVSIVPGGKLLKPIAKIAKGNKAWKVAMKIADKTVVKTADEIFVALKTEKNTAFFYSGTTDGIGGIDKALEIAKSKGGTTIDEVLTTQNITLPKFNPTDASISEIWEQTSKAYAKNASGEVKAVIGQTLRDNNVWENIELPALISNPNVTKIIKIDPKTLVETIIHSK